MDERVRCFTRGNFISDLLNRQFPKVNARTKRNQSVIGEAFHSSRIIRVFIRQAANAIVKETYQGIRQVTPLTPGCLEKHSSGEGIKYLTIFSRVPNT